MKKMRKIFAVLLTLAMVLAMSMTAFAANPTQVNIKLNNLNNASEVKYMQIIRPNREQPTGWKFINGAGNAVKGNCGLFRPVGGGEHGLRAENTGT